MDCTDRGSISAAQKKVKEEVGKLHILVNKSVHVLQIPSYTQH